MNADSNLFGWHSLIHNLNRSCYVEFGQYGSSYAAPHQHENRAVGSQCESLCVARCRSVRLHKTLGRLQIERFPKLRWQQKVRLIVSSFSFFQ